MAFSTGVSLLSVGGFGYNLGQDLRTAYDCENTDTSGIAVSQNGSIRSFVAGHNGNCDRATYPSSSSNFFYRYLTNIASFPNGNPFTYSIWFRSSQPYTNTSQDILRLGVVNVKYNHASLNGASSQQVLNSANYFNYLGNWQNLIVWYNGNTIAGSLNNGTTNSGNKAYFSLFVGASPNWGYFNYGLQGVVNGGGTAFMEVDQVFTWNRVLNTEERSLLWNSGSGRSATSLSAIVGY